MGSKKRIGAIDDRPAGPAFARRALGVVLALAASLGVSLGAFLAPSLAAAEPLVARIGVDATVALHPANRLLVGSNTPWVFGSEGFTDEAGKWRPAMLASVRRLAPTVLRYPGTPDTYHWRQGIGPVEDRPKVLAYPKQPLQKIVFGTQEFLETCEALGALPLIEVNLHDGSDDELAQQAADWVRYVNKQVLPSRHTGRALPKVPYWELGNEPYLMNSKLDGGGANPLFLKPAAYARRVAKVMAAMRAVDPTIRIGLPFALDTLSGRPWKPNAEPASVVGEQLGYAQALLAGLDRPQDVSFLALHDYMPLLGDLHDGKGGTLAPPSDEAMYWAAAAGSETLRRHLAAVKAFWQAQPATKALPLPRLIVTEYNSFFTNAFVQGKDLPQNAYVTTQAGALFVADLLRMLSLEPSVEAAMQWSLTGNWVFGAVAHSPPRAPGEVRPVFHAMRMAHQLLDSGDVVPVTVASETTDKAAQQIGFSAPYPAMPLVTATATRQTGAILLLVVNKDPAREAEVVVALKGVRAAAATVVQVEAERPFSAPESDAASVLRESTATIGADGREVRFTLGKAAFGLLRVSVK